MNKPPNKSQGRGVMTSDFIEVLSGVVRYNDEVWEKIKDQESIKEEVKKVGEERARRAGVILDTSKDGYYTTEKAIPDFLKVIFTVSKGCLALVRLQAHIMPCMHICSAIYGII